MLGLCAAIAIITPASGAARGIGRFDAADLEGSHEGVVQPVVTGVRAALVGVVPGSAEHEAWAIGRSSAKLHGWAGEAGGGQTVFMHYLPSTGWLIAGPPRSANGTVENPSLNALSIAANGEGWSVGDDGALWHLKDGVWSSQPGSSDQLIAVSVAEKDGALFGFAIAAGPRILKLANGHWSEDPLTVPAGATWILSSVATSSPSDAWAAGRSGRSVLVLHRSTDGWSRVRTGQSLFDEEQKPRQAGNIVIESTPGSAVTATAGGAWVGGTLLPLSTTAGLNDVAGDPTRPFILHFAANGVSTYCPDAYSTGSNGSTSSNICDQPLPLSAFGISSLTTAGKDVFAGGLGLFHFRSNQWIREPDPLGPVTAMSFSSLEDGWIASTGDTVGGSGSSSSIATLGHWTREPSSPHIARWPEPITDPQSELTQAMQAVAIAPDGSGRAIAVGDAGSCIVYSKATGSWAALAPTNANAYHAVAWAGRIAWIVGEHGTIYQTDGLRAPVQTPASEHLTTASLFGVAFAGDGTGYAVGANGTILRFDGDVWRIDSQSRRVTDNDLYAIARTGSGFVAAGADGTVLAEQAGRWIAIGGLGQLVGRGPSGSMQMPTLDAVAGLSDGTALVGGEFSTLIRRDGPGGQWHVDTEGKRVPPEGTILSLAAARVNGDIRVFAGMTYAPAKFSGDVPAAVSGFVLEGTHDGWQDLGYSARQSIYPTFDGAAPVEPPDFIALDDANHAWVAAGSGEGVDDNAGNSQEYPSSAIFRINTEGDPFPPGNTTSPQLKNSPSVVSFAYFGESSCGRLLCSAAIGSNTKADVVAKQIRDEINAAAELPGGPKFVVFGGDMRRLGIPDELGPFKRFLDGFHVPVFAALGGNDLFAGLQNPLSAPVDVRQLSQLNSNSVTADGRFYQSLFDDRPAPWGGSKRWEKTFVPVNALAANGARTHYAFDYAPDGAAALRVVVLDDSTSERLTTDSTQNPTESQQTFLKNSIDSASSPVIVVMNQPDKDPLVPASPSNANITTMQTVAGQEGASAVVTSYYRENGVQDLNLSGVGVPKLAGLLPIYTFGGGGAPLQETSFLPHEAPEPSLGKYNSWQLLSVDRSRKTNSTSTVPQYKTWALSYPVVDSVTITAVNGTTVPGGQTLSFVGAGHSTVGGGSGDPLQSKAAVIPFTFASRGVCAPNPGDGGIPSCRSTGPIGPAYTFKSEDQAIGYFVRPSLLDASVPELDQNGNPIPDASSGLFCATHAGTTNVDLDSGFHQARMTITVTGGFGPCVKKPVVVVHHIQKVIVNPVFTPRVVHPVVPFTFFHRHVDSAQLGVPAPPPIPVVAPAPPVSVGYGKKEQTEHAPDTTSQEFTALFHRSRFDAQTDTRELLGAILFMSVLGAAGAVTMRRRFEASRAWVRSDGDEL